MWSYGKIYFGFAIYFISDSLEGKDACRNQIGFACAGSNPAVRDFMADVPEWLRGLTRTFFLFTNRHIKGERSLIPGTIPGTWYLCDRCTYFYKHRN